MKNLTHGFGDDLVKVGSVVGPHYAHLPESLVQEEHNLTEHCSHAKKLVLFEFSPEVMKKI